MKEISPPCVTGIRIIQSEFYQYQEQAFPSRSSAFFALELAGECGELANLEKKSWRDSTRSPPDERFAEEAADTLIAILNYANTRGIDLEAEVTKKLTTIEERRRLGLMGAVASP